MKKKRAARKALRMITTAIATKNNTNNANGYSYFKVAAPPIAPVY